MDGLREFEPGFVWFAVVLCGLGELKNLVSGNSQLASGKPFLVSNGFLWSFVVSVN